MEEANKLELSLVTDFDEFEKVLIDSPTKELNKPRSVWKGGNVLHGLMNMTNNEMVGGPPLMDCEHEQWLYLG